MVIFERFVQSCLWKHKLWFTIVVSSFILSFYISLLYLLSLSHIIIFLAILLIISSHCFLLFHVITRYITVHAYMLVSCISLVSLGSTLTEYIGSVVLILHFRTSSDDFSPSFGVT